MSKKSKSDCINCEKEFLDRFNNLSLSRSKWQVWSDFITASACAISNSFGIKCSDYANRESEYKECIDRLGGVEVPGEMLGLVIMALNKNPEQDFLGHMFMTLELGNNRSGQFFTPYSLCELMADLNFDDVNSKILEKGWVSINDCACGAGALLIASANKMKKNNVNYQNHALFVAQDIDRVAGMMCYIQLSLLGCAGYVVIADTISNPICGEILYPTVSDNQELWVTPMFSSDVWTYRKLINNFVVTK